ncbi:glycosyltransferase [Vibrio maerlii]|uniref:glycosyltransferase n=1 Tax=Vibrio maerlii TaxID=2231648 RepID=UPI000E3C1575|nr:glycosyltransferase [Vibrio maerlii]
MLEVANFIKEKKKLTGKVKYSIIVPCYNEEHYISNILKSLELTEYDVDKFEVIVSLNNCKDRTEEVVCNYKSTSKMNIRVVHERTPGVSYARNFGAKCAVGDYYIFLDADNIVQKSFFRDVDEFSSDRNFSVATIKTMPDRNSLRGFVFFFLLEWIKVTFQKPFGKSIIRKDIFEEIKGFDTGIKLGENIDVLLKAKRASKQHGGIYQHLSNSIYCSLRRFDEQGYTKIALPWLVAYLGVKTLDYKTFSEIEKVDIKRRRWILDSLPVRYFHSYLLYPVLEKLENRSISSKLNCFSEFEEAVGKRRDEIIKQKLYTVLKEAGEHVPYYRRLFKEYNFKAEDILKDIRNIEKLPYLTKDIVQREGNNLIDVRYQSNTLHKRKTSGSSGVSTSIYYSQEALDWSSASHLYVSSWSGKKPHMKEIHLSTKFPESLPLQERIRENVKCKALNRANITTHSFDDVDMEHILRGITEENAYSIEGHPSTLYALALYIKNKNLLFSKPPFDVFVSTGEVLDSKKRDVIKKYIGCSIYNRYGNAEFGVIAHERECCNQSLKVIDNMVFPELYSSERDNSEHSSLGKSELVLSTLTNTAMPLIRYRTGDLVESLVKNDNGYLITNIEGRVHDLVNIGSKIYPTHYIQDLFGRLGDITEFQIEAVDDSKINLYIVAPNVDEHQTIKSKVEKWWNESVEVHFVQLHQLKKSGWRDKFRYVIRQ